MSEKPAKIPPEKKKQRKARPWKKWLITALIILLCVGAIIALQVFVPKQKEELVVPDVPPINVETQIVRTLERLVDRIVLPSIVEPNRVVLLSAEVAGEVKELMLDEGEKVEAGQVLMLLDTELLQSEYDRAEAQAELAKVMYQRMVNLHRDGAVTDRELDQARADLTVARATLETARIRLARSRITVPVAGVLNRLLVEEGEYMQPGMVVAEIVDMSKAKIIVRVPEKDIDFFSVGDEALVITNIRGKARDFSGKITYISELADDSTRTTRLEIIVPNEERVLRSGHIVKAELTRRVLSDVVMIPLEAVIPLEVGYAVYVVGDRFEKTMPVEADSDDKNGNEAEAADQQQESDNDEENDDEADAAEDPEEEIVQLGYARRRTVDLGVMRGRSVQVIDGLEEGDELIVVGQRFVGPGQLVRIMKTQ